MVYSHDAMKLNHFHVGCLRKLMRIRWQDKVPDTEVLIWADIPSSHTLLMKSQMRWAGHVTRMSDEQLPKEIFYAELKEGKCSQGGQKKCFKDSLKLSLGLFNTDPEF